MSGLIRARLASARPVSPDVTDFRFALESPATLEFLPGQFVTFAIGMDSHGQPIRRSYSLASSLHNRHEIRLLIKLLPDGPAHDFFATLAPGQNVDMTGPHGFFVLDAHHHGDVVFAATGTGLAPILPMLDELAQRQEPGRRYLFWGLRAARDLFLEQELRALCKAAQTDLHIYLSQPGPTWAENNGRITEPVLTLLPGLTKPTFYLVGNGNMIRELKKRLMDAGINRKQHIRTEAFFD